MAIVKHSSSKNARYEDVLEYYTCRHREDSRTGYYAPILDKYGLMQPRSDCAVLYLTADGTAAAPERWASACRRTNLCYSKNNKPQRISAPPICQGWHHTILREIGSSSSAI